MTTTNPSAALRASLRPVAIAGVAVAALFVGGFTAWGVYAPLASAAIAPGVVSPDSSRKTIQHLEGGIVQEILVTEGDRVLEGDLLMRLSPVQALASFSARQRQWHRFEAERLRLQALERDAAELTFPAALTAVADPDYQAFLANQQAQFAVERKSLSERQAILGRRIGQLDQEVAAIERENEGLGEQLDIVAEEIADKGQAARTEPHSQARAPGAAPGQLAAQGPDRLQRSHDRAGRPEGRRDRAADPVAEDRLPGHAGQGAGAGQ